MLQVVAELHDVDGEPYCHCRDKLQLLQVVAELGEEHCLGHDELQLLLGAAELHAVRGEEHWLGQDGHDCHDGVLLKMGLHGGYLYEQIDQALI